MISDDSLDDSKQIGDNHQNDVGYDEVSDDDQDQDGEEEMDDQQSDSVVSHPTPSFLHQLGLGNFVGNWCDSDWYLRKCAHKFTATELSFIKEERKRLFQLEFGLDKFNGTWQDADDCLRKYKEIFTEAEFCFVADERNRLYEARLIGLEMDFVTSSTMSSITSSENSV